VADLIMVLTCRYSDNSLSIALTSFGERFHHEILRAFVKETNLQLFVNLCGEQENWRFEQREAQDWPRAANFLSLTKCRYRHTVRGGGSLMTAQNTPRVLTASTNT
jgi:hypothetical protein